MAFSNVSKLIAPSFHIFCQCIILLLVLTLNISALQLLRKFYGAKTMVDSQSSGNFVVALAMNSRPQSALGMP